MSLARYLALFTNLCLFAAPAAHAQSAPSDDAGLALPPNFHATIFADHLGHPRHLAVAPNGVVYANTWSGRYFHFDAIPPGGFLIAMRAADSNGPASEIVRFGPTADNGNHGGTGVWVHDGYLYAETNDRIVRYKLADNGGRADRAGRDHRLRASPLSGDHPMHPVAIDLRGRYVRRSRIGDQRVPRAKIGVAGVPGINPCTELETARRHLAL